MAFQGLATFVSAVLTFALAQSEGISDALAEAVITPLASGVAPHLGASAACGAYAGMMSVVVVSERQREFKDEVIIMECAKSTILMCFSPFDPLKVNSQLSLLKP